MDDAIELRHPDQFQGFERLSRRYEPLLRDALETLRASGTCNDIRENFLFGVVEHPQPAFMLLPLMYLSFAERCGGITARHRAYLPWQVLTMELIALYDDTVDYTPLRSNRPTYSARYGAASAAAFSGYVYSLIVSKTATIAPEILPLLTRLFERLCSLEVWEHQSRYPEVSSAGFAAWTRNRYDAVHPVLAYSLDSALLLRGLEPLPYPAHVAFGDLQQDVDDLVNVVEERERNGENDDIKLGIVTYPLLATLEAEPAAAAILERIWSEYRVVRPGEDRRAALEACARRTAEDYASLHELIRRHGVSATMEKMLRDAAASVDAAPDELRGAFAPFVYGFLDRHRHLDARARIEAHVPVQGASAPPPCP